MHATVPAMCVEKFEPLLVENRAYVLSMFHVVRNLNHSMGTYSKYRTILRFKTEIMATTSSFVPLYGLFIVSSQDIMRSRVDAAVSVG